MLTLLAQANNPGNGTGGVILAGGFLLVFLAILLVTSIFWLWMLIDCLISNKPAVEKVLWVLVIFFLHVLGAILYFLLGRGQSRSTV
jgi:ABC-type multidrug transport system fused ATPase/permease subunit